MKADSTPHDQASLDRYLRPPVKDLDAGEETAVRRVLAALEPRPARARLRWLAAGAGVAVVTAVAIASLTSPGPAPVRLHDGSAIATKAPGDVVVEQDGPLVTKARVVRGEAVFNLRPQRGGRTFEVYAADVTIRVLGTSFRVVREGPRVEVEVRDGTVVVEPPSASPVELHAGQRWEGGPSLVPSTPAPLTIDEPSIAPPAPAASHARRAKTSPSAQPPRNEPTGETTLFEAADRARLARDPRRAERLFDEFRRTHRRAPLAGLAALQLGRIRLDMGDLVGAREALGDAIALAPGATFRNVAEARLVEVLDRLGDGQACRMARRQYLERYNQGVHVEEVRKRCRQDR